MQNMQRGYRVYPQCPFVIELSEIELKPHKTVSSIYHRQPNHAIDFRFFRLSP